MERQRTGIADALRCAIDRTFAYGLAFLLALSAGPTPFAYANPAGGTVSGGAATISTSGNTETITQTSSRAVIDWSSFNIGSGETTQFIQPSSSSLTVNRVSDMNPSQILGSLTANGNIVLINPNGVFFAPGSTVDVNGLIATTSNVSSAEVMAGGKLHFTPGGNPSASVVNEGTITAAQAGLVGLVAPNVENSGVINANLGTVHLASGDSFTLDLYGDKLMEIGVSDAVSQQFVQNSGVINAAGGTVKLTAAAGRQIVNSLIDVSGEIHTPTFAQHNGEIDIYAAGSNAVRKNVAANKGQKQGSSEVLVSGTLDASGKGAGQSGGTISVLGDNVGILSGALIDASGDAGGGNIKIGGDFHGQGKTPTALKTLVQSGANIFADAITTGNGGNVAVWADNYTDFAGFISATGGAESGNGGFVETSGHNLLSLADANGNNGMVYASAPNGVAGTWLLDPADLVITTSTSNITTETNTPSSGSTTYIPNGSANTSDILNTTIDTALNAGTNVYLTTGGDSESGPNGGSITVSAAISATGAGTALTTTGSLTLSSYKNIIITSGDTITLGGGTNNSSQTVTGGTLTLQADNAGNGSGYINIAGAISTNGGNITMGGGSGTITAGILNSNGTLNTAATGFATGNSGQASGIFINNVSVNAADGNIIANGTGYNSTNSNNFGVEVNNTSGILETNGSGNISISGNGEGNTSGGSDHGVYINSGAAISTVNGTLTVIGTGGGSTSTGGSDYGVIINGSNSTIETTGATGSILINGTGGGGTNSSGNNSGVGVNTPNGIQATSTGSITITAYGGTVSASSFNAHGVLVGAGSAGSITGNGGAMNITGTGGTGGNNNNFGVVVSGTGSVISNTGTGTLTVNGTGNGTGNSANDPGIEIENGGVISTVNGALAVTGTGGGAGSGTGGYGVYVENTSSTIETTGSGALTVTGVGGANSSTGLEISIANGIQTTGTGSITINADTFSLSQANDINSIANLTLAPYTAGNSVSVYGSTGTVAYTSSLLADVTAASYTFGNTSDSNSLTAAAHTWTTPVSFVTGTGAITLAGVQAMGANNLTLESDTLPTISATPTGTGTLSIMPASVSMGVLGGAGTLSVSSAYLTSLGTGWTGYSFGNASDTNLLTINAATWTTPLTLKSGSGGISINGAQSMGANSFLANTAGNITFGSGSSVTSTASGNAVVLAAGGNFVNNSGSNSPLTAGSGRWIVYSTQASADTNGASVMNPAQTIYNETYGSEAPGSVPNAGQNTWLYSTAGLITITASGQTVTYGTAPNTSAVLGTTYSFSCSNGCSSSVVTGGPTLTISGSNGTSTSSNYNVGSWTITPSGMTVSNGDSISYVTGTLTVNAKGLTLTGFAANNKTYNGATAATISSNGSLSGVVGSDSVTLNSGSASAAFDNANVGTTHTVTASGYTLGSTDAGNYTLTQPTATNVTISALALTITADAESATYGDTLGTLAYTDSGLAPGDSFSGTLTTANGGVGTVLKHANGFDVSGSPFAITQGTLTVSDGNGGNNYAITYNSANLTLAAKAITDSGFAANNKTYDSTTAATISNNGSLSGIVSGDTVNLNSSGASATFDNANVGTTHTVMASGYALAGAQASDYSLTQPTATNVTISAAGLTITANNQTHTYGFGSLGTMGYSITSGTLYGTDAVSGVTLSTNDTASTSGDYKATSSPATITPSAAVFSSGSASNYSITYDNAPTGLTVNKATLTLTGFAANNKTYDGLTTATISSNGSLSGVVGSDSVTLNSGSASAAFDNANVGTTHTVTASGYTLGSTDAGNYTLTQPTATNVTISALALTITADAESATYGDTLGTLAYTDSGLAPGDSFSGTLTTANGGAGTVLKHANGFDVSGSPFAITQGTLTVSDGNGGNNYAITYNSANLTLAAKAITDSGFAANNKTYDSTTAATISNNGSLSGIVSGDTVNLNSSGASATFDNANVGTTHTVMASGYALAGAQASDYSLTQPTATNVTISAAGLTITADNQTHTYGFGSLGTMGYSITSGTLYGTDAVSGVTLSTNDTASTSGDYKATSSPATITPSAAVFSSGSASNYSITYDNAPTGLTVNKATLTLTGFAANNKTYDGLTTATISSNGSLSGVVGSDSVTLDTSGASAAFDNKNLGTTHTVAASGYALGSTDAGNYTLSQPTATNVTISAAALTITANGKTMTYGTGNTYNGFSTAGLFAGDAVSSVSFSTNDTDSTSGNWKAGSYLITPSNAAGTGLANYTITYNTGALNVNPATLIISGFAASNKNYDGTTAATISSNGSLSGVASGDQVSLNATVASATFDNANVGFHHTVTASGYGLTSGNGNNDAADYALTQPTATNVTINNANGTAPGQAATLPDTVVEVQYNPQAIYYGSQSMSSGVAANDNSPNKPHVGGGTSDGAFAWPVLDQDYAPSAGDPRKKKRAATD